MNIVSYLVENTVLYFIMCDMPKYNNFYDFLSLIFSSSTNEILWEVLDIWSEKLFMSNAISK